jgi:hypothetical protein
MATVPWAAAIREFGVGSEFDGFELEEVRAVGYGRAIPGVVFAGLTVAPVLVVLFSGPGADDEVAVIALDRAEQLEAFESGLPVDDVCPAGEALLELRALAFGDVEGVDLHNRRVVPFIGGVGLVRWHSCADGLEVRQADSFVIEAGGAFAGGDPGGAEAGALRAFHGR